MTGPSRDARARERERERARRNQRAMCRALKKPSGAEICGNDGSIDGAKSTIEHRGLSAPVNRHRWSVESDVAAASHSRRTIRVTRTAMTPNCINNSTNTSAAAIAACTVIVRV